MNDAAPTPNTHSRVMVAKRFFAAPRALVFRLWTDPAHLEKWWGPHGFTTETETFEFRPGGIWRHTMIGPDGTRYANEARFVAIEAPSRIVYDQVAPPFRSTITFTEREGGTEVKVRMAFPSAAERRRVTEEYGAEQGLAQTLERLGEVLTNATVEVAFDRVFPVSRATMFRLWTEPGHLQQWWGPRGFTNPECQFEPRPGGAIFILMRAPDGTEHPMGGEVLSISQSSRLVFAARALAQDGTTLLEAHTEVEFEDHPNGCLVRLQARGVARDPVAIAMLTGMREGWSLSLDRLESHASTAADRVLLIERRFKAPPAVVFRAWTDPAQTRLWMGPPQFTATTFEPAAGPGEPWRACLTNDATGEENWQSGTLLAAEEPSHLAMTFAWDRADGSRSPETLITIDFIAEGQGTLMRFRQEGFAAATARDNHNGGWTGSFNRLEQLVSGNQQ
jgi:uncharacterized protein YndB with AHSA1/START domain